MERREFAIKVVSPALFTLALFLVYQFAKYKGLPIVLVVMAILISLFVFVTTKMVIGRRAGHDTTYSSSAVVQYARARRGSSGERLALRDLRVLCG